MDLFAPKQSSKREQAAVKILIVDSDPASVHQLSSAIKRCGHVALEATTFQEAKQLWKAERPGVLIADVRLGQFNGLQLLLRARLDRPDLCAVITCGFPDKVLEAETQRFGGTFMVKPVTPDEVLANVFGPGKAQSVPIDRVAERRRLERRQFVEPEFVPERRAADRRQPSNRH